MRRLFERRGGGNADVVTTTAAAAGPLGSPTIAERIAALHHSHLTHHNRKRPPPGGSPLALPAASIEQREKEFEQFAVDPLDDMSWPISVQPWGDDLSSSRQASSSVNQHLEEDESEGGSNDYYFDQNKVMDDAEELDEKENFRTPRYGTPRHALFESRASFLSAPAASSPAVSQYSTGRSVNGRIDHFVSTMRSLQAPHGASPAEIAEMDELRKMVNTTFAQRCRGPNHRNTAHMPTSAVPPVDDTEMKLSPVIIDPTPILRHAAPKTQKQQPAPLLASPESSKSSNIQEWWTHMWNGSISNGSSMARDEAEDYDATAILSQCTDELHGLASGFAEQNGKQSLAEDDGYGSFRVEKRDDVCDITCSDSSNSRLGIDERFDECDASIARDTDVAVVRTFSLRRSWQQDSSVEEDADVETSATGHVNPKKVDQNPVFSKKLDDGFRFTGNAIAAPDGDNDEQSITRATDIAAQPFVPRRVWQTKTLQNDMKPSAVTTASSLSKQFVANFDRTLLMIHDDGLDQLMTHEGFLGSGDTEDLVSPPAANGSDFVANFNDASGHSVTDEMLDTDKASEAIPEVISNAEKGLQLPVSRDPPSVASIVRPQRRRALQDPPEERRMSPTQRYLLQPIFKSSPPKVDEDKPLETSSFVGRSLIDTDSSSTASTSEQAAAKYCEHDDSLSFKTGAATSLFGGLQSPATQTEAIRDSADNDTTGAVRMDVIPEVVATDAFEEDSDIGTDVAFYEGKVSMRSTEHDDAAAAPYDEAPSARSGAQTSLLATAFYQPYNKTDDAAFRGPDVRPSASNPIREYWKSFGSIKTKGSFDSVSVVNDADGIADPYVRAKMRHQALRQTSSGGGGSDPYERRYIRDHATTPLRQNGSPQDTAAATAQEFHLANTGSPVSPPVTMGTFDESQVSAIHSVPRKSQPSPHDSSQCRSDDPQTSRRSKLDRQRRKQDPDAPSNEHWSDRLAQLVNPILNVATMDDTATVASCNESAEKVAAKKAEACSLMCGDMHFSISGWFC